MTHLGTPDRTLCGLTPEDAEALHLPPIRISKAPTCLLCRASQARTLSLLQLRAATDAPGAWFPATSYLRHAWQLRE